MVSSRLDRRGLVLASQRMEFTLLHRGTAASARISGFCMAPPRRRRRSSADVFCASGLRQPRPDDLRANSREGSSCPAARCPAGYENGAATDALLSLGIEVPDADG
jgi:hypothetical protein